MTSPEAALLLSLAAAFTPFALVTSATPGPNTAMLASSGATFGVRRTLPHVLGIVIGFPLMVVAVGIGLTEVFHRYPWTFQALNLVGVAYLLYLAWRIGTSSHSEREVQVQRPLTFSQAALFQWVNPKAWVMAAGACSVYIDPSAREAPQLALVTLIFFLVAVPTTLTWTAFGAVIGRTLASSPTRLRLFNILMGLLLAASVLPELLSAHIPR